jgi:hypothetical protein
MTSLPDYEELIASARQRFDESSAVRILHSMKDAAFAELFLIHFCALGVYMTRPVDGWIRRAAARCAEMGFTRLGRDLALHASAEADHHLLMIDDLRSLASRWNAGHSPPVDADALLGRPPSLGVMKYCRLHEDSIASETPFAQVAIEYEIEALPLRYGQLVVERCIDLLGPDIIPSLSFITKHIMLDGAHTEFNARALSDLIELAPWSLSALAGAGAAALDAYASFLSDCVQLAEDQASKVEVRFAARPPLEWRLKSPILWRPKNENDRSSLDWLAEVRALRGRVLFDGGKRPAFRTPDGAFLDPDPVDFHAFHILAYDGARLVGCVRLYHLDRDGPASVTEQIFGEKSFSQMLQTLGAQRFEIVEIGRWIVDPDYRVANRDFALSIQLAAASGALANALGKASDTMRGFAICAAGTKDRQDAMLKRFGMAPVSGISPIYCDDYRDEVRMLYCSQTRRLSPLFQWFIDRMAKKIELDDAIFEPFRLRVELIRLRESSADAL